MHNPGIISKNSHPQLNTLASGSTRFLDEAHARGFSSGTLAAPPSATSPVHDHTTPLSTYHTTRASRSSHATLTSHSSSEDVLGPRPHSSLITRFNAALPKALRQLQDEIHHSIELAIAKEAPSESEALSEEAPTKQKLVEMLTTSNVINGIIEYLCNALPLPAHPEDFLHNATMPVKPQDRKVAKLKEKLTTLIKEILSEDATLSGLIAEAPHTQAILNWLCTKLPESIGHCLTQINFDLITLRHKEILRANIRTDIDEENSARNNPIVDALAITIQPPRTQQAHKSKPSEQQLTLGKGLTFIAMIPQAVFAGLLTYDLLNVRFTKGGAGIIALFAVGGVQAGKYILVEYLGRDNWEIIYKGIPLISVKGYKNFIRAALKATIVATGTGTFSLLAKVAMADPKNGLGQLIRTDFNADTLAAICETPAVWLPMAAASFACNVPAFNTIFNVGLEKLYRLLGLLLSWKADLQAYLKAQRDLDHGINYLIQPINSLAVALREKDSAIKEDIINLYLQEIIARLEFVLGEPADNMFYDYLSPQDKINALLNQDRRGIKLREQFQNLAELDREYKAEVLPIEMHLSRVSAIAGVASAGITCAGLSNFRSFGEQFGSLLIDEPHVDSVFGVIEMLAMVLMATFALEFGSSIANWIFAKCYPGIESRHHVDLLPTFARPGIFRGGRLQLHIEALLICVAIGGLANAMQSVIVGQSAAYIALAVIASAILEFWVWHKSRSETFERYIVDNNRLGELSATLGKLSAFIDSMKYDNVEPSPTILIYAWASLRAMVCCQIAKPPEASSTMPLLNAYSASPRVNAAAGVSRRFEIEGSPA
ncbi:MAG: hypothetical protein Q7V63_05830 [Gammaproteobacteria bacterium]|nr:hypothetical protein [Gammaproteobacteria bacterium]